MNHTINDPGHPPQPEQDEQACGVKGVFLWDVHNIQDEGHNHDDCIKHLKLVVEKLEPIRVQLKAQLHHEEGKQRQAEVMKHLQNDTMSNYWWEFSFLIMERDYFALDLASAHLWSDVVLVCFDYRQV